MGFIDFDEMECDLKKTASMKLAEQQEAEEEPLEAEEIVVLRQKSASMQRSSTNVLDQQKSMERQNGKQKVTYCSVCREQSTLYFVVMFFFILTDLYCRIYPILIIPAYSKKYFEDDDTLRTLCIALSIVGVGLLVAAYELIAYRMILLEGYNEWSTVFKQLYFASFTISFFLLSTMGLAYLEKNVNFERLMKYEYRGRMLIGLLFVLTVLCHQLLTLDYVDWHFVGTTWAYFVVLLCSVAAHFYL